MSAKDMFKKLGYEERTETNSMACIKSYINYKNLNIIYFDYDKSIDLGKIIVTMDLLQAINQQVKELGWHE